MKLENLEPDELFIVKWQFRMLGDFNTALIEAIARADINNRAKLAQGFPVEVKGYINYTEQEDWWETVQKKAETGP